MIADHYTRHVDVHRLGSAVNETEEYVLFSEGVACHIQPLEDSFSEDINGNFGKDWLMFTDDQTILEGDRIIDQDDAELVYKVVSKEAYAFRGGNKHAEYRIRKSNP